MSRADTAGVEAGFRRLDEIITGFQPANLVILAARPSMGKTALALNIARNVAVDQARAWRSSLWRCQDGGCAAHALFGGQVDSHVAPQAVQTTRLSKLTSACAPLFRHPSSSTTLHHPT